MTPENEKLISLIKRIYEKTKAGELNWEATSDPTTFAVSFPDYSISIEHVLETEDMNESFIFRISNDEGLTIEELSSYSARQYGFGEMKALFDLARRNAMGLNRALDVLLHELDQPQRRKS